MDMMSAEQRLEQSEKINHMSGVPQAIKQMLTGPQMTCLLDSRAPTFKTKHHHNIASTGTIEREERIRDHDGTCR